MHTRYSILATFLVLSFGLFGVGCDSGGDDGDLVASFEVETTNSTINLRDRSRYPGGGIDSRTWELGDGTTAQGQGVEHTYDEAGEYTVTLTVEGTDGTTNSTSRDVSIGTQQFEVIVENVGQSPPDTSFFSVTDNGTLGGPIGPGGSAEFSFTIGTETLSGAGAAFSFAARLDPSSDAFYAFQPEGIALFKESGAPLGQDGPVSVADQVRLWDAGTGSGENQITEITDDEEVEGSGSTSIPATSDAIDVTIASEKDLSSAGGSGGYEFTVTVENLTDPGDGIQLEAGTYAAHLDQLPGISPDSRDDVDPENDVRYPGFVVALDDSTVSSGLADLAQDGNTASHINELDQVTGLTVPLSPGAFATHSEAIQPFDLDQQASNGLERLAEDGSAGPLAEALAGEGAVTDGGTFGDGPLFPTERDTFYVAANTPGEDDPGDRLSLATMHIQSNDYFYAFDPIGLPLFNDSGDPISGDQTATISIYNAGTERDQTPGVGLNQAPRQPGPDTGPSENGPVQRVTSNIGSSSLFDVIEVTVSPVSP